MVTTALTVAGSDTSGGAGLQADLKTFEEFGVYGVSAITSIVTYAPDRGFIHDLDFIAPDVLIKQLRSAFALHDFGVVKSGMLGTAENVSLLASALRDSDAPFVFDPVLACKGQGEMVDLKQSFVDELVPAAAVITPNLDEAAQLTGMDPLTGIDDMKQAAAALHARGADAVLVKGGARLDGDAAVDILFDGRVYTAFDTPKLGRLMVNGAGCSLASAIAAGIALGNDVPTSVKNAKEYVTHAIAAHTPNASGVDSVWHAASRLAPSTGVEVTAKSL
ncbi:bifunctional hydroxymethylpyrimidine kinase/phosphomethylpyrimidine kinase [Spelaeicoccus albus]|uniref:pyridoxal kinase n=1 Tax=Spelaeicoccus albus TaxID=1280376 RepID=A0A7Z0IIK4_9MICO|nr:hydroxymethylpyrimidine/phosphomethylpyrimidine kinase [Spelaeicoccus albus]NYI68481.1 pyridoxine kinase [Spelaeicoccus albus]